EEVLSAHVEKSVGQFLRSLFSVYPVTAEQLQHVISTHDKLEDKIRRGYDEEKPSCCEDTELTTPSSVSSLSRRQSFCNPFHTPVPTRKLSMYVCISETGEEYERVTLPHAKACSSFTLPPGWCDLILNPHLLSRVLIPLNNPSSDSTSSRGSADLHTSSETHMLARSPTIITQSGRSIALSVADSISQSVILLTAMDAEAGSYSQLLREKILSSPQPITEPPSPFPSSSTTPHVAPQNHSIPEPHSLRDLTPKHATLLLEMQSCVHKQCINEGISPSDVKILIPYPPCVWHFHAYVIPSNMHFPPCFGTFYSIETVLRTLHESPSLLRKGDLIIETVLRTLHESPSLLRKGDLMFTVASNHPLTFHLGDACTEEGTKIDQSEKVIKEESSQEAHE
ncbi:hypothetical protein ADUPG1_000303, partial [Aduncisulcus paluster]